MKLPRGLLSLLTVLFVLILLGAGVFWRLRGSGEEGDETIAASEAPSTEGVVVASAEQYAGATAVQGAEVIRGTLWTQVVATGEAAANRMSVLASRSSGIVQRVLVRENDAVREGDLLVQLDTIEAAMSLVEAEAALRRARSDYQVAMLGAERVDNALSAAREENVRISSGLVGAEAAVERARMALEQTRIRAPFSGRVADLIAVEGAFLGSGSNVLTLVQLDPIRVEVNVLEGQMVLLAPGRRASVTFSATPQDTFAATVESINPIVDRASSSGRVTLVLPNPQGKILPGMFANTVIEAQAYPNRILVPREAILERSDERREMVFMFLPREGSEEEGMAQWRYVFTGLRNDRLVEITGVDDNSEMLQPGEVILVNGHHYLAHDVSVRLVEDSDAEGGIPGQ